MAALIKNALIKQISKYLKNVTPNQINISTLKGEGEMTNIQLDENVIMDLLELPLWLKITSARCNRASVKVPWTKLKTNPILIILDKIDLDMELADPLRECNSASGKLFDKEPISAYGFIDKCIDGIQLNIDSVTITIKSNVFNANLNISNIYVFSTTPNWKPAQTDIRMTRLKDLDKDEIILYKVITWEICRLEAFNVEPQNLTNSQAPTSIKLIMNPSQMQIALKKKLSDKSLINSTVRVLLNEIYWMANDTQLKSAIGTYNTLSKLMKKAFAQKIKYANYQNQNSQNKTKLPQSPVNQNQKNQQPNNQQPKIDISKVFMQYDIKETSLHLQISTLNVHLYADDNYSGDKLIDGGAMQLLFKNLCIDHYPYHKIGSTINHWNNFNYAFKQREDWSKTILSEFVTKLETILNKSDIKDLTQIKLKSSINLMEACTIVTLKDFCLLKVTTNMSDKKAHISTMKTTKKSQEDANKTSSDVPPIYCPNDTLKQDRYFIEQQLYDKRAFLSSNYTEFNLPSDTLFANIIFSEFYFPDDCNYPIPSPQLFVQVSPIILNIDFLSLLWINTLLFSLYREKLIVDESDKTSKTPKQQKSTPTLHCDTYVELITPKLVLTIYPSKKVEYTSKHYVKRPTTIELGVARLFLTNQTTTSGVPINSKKFSDLKSTSEKCYEVVKFLSNKNTKFPVHEPSLHSLAPCFSDLIKNENLPYQRYDLSFDDDLTKLVNTTTQALNTKEGLFLKSLNRNTLNKNASKDVWSFEFESAWVDFKDMVTGESSTFIENTNFRFYLVNVYDFYSNDVYSDTKVDKKSSEVSFQKAYDRLSMLIDLNVDEPLEAPPIIEKQKKRSNSISGTNTPNTNDLCRTLYSQVNVIGEIKELHVSTNHSQILFLLRLVDTLEQFGNQLKADSEQTLKYKTSGLKNNAEVEKPKKTQKIRCLNLEDLAQMEVDTSESDETSINLAVSIQSIQVDLVLNDLRKEKTMPPVIKQANLIDLCDQDSGNESNFVESRLNNIDIKVESSPLPSLEINKEFMLSYIKFIYGLSTENPNTCFKFQAKPAVINSSSNKDLLLSASIDSGFLSSDKSSLAVSYSNLANSSSKNRTSSINKMQTSESDLFLDDNDNISLIMSLEQDDSSSMVNIDIGNSDSGKENPAQMSCSASELSISASMSNKTDENQTDSTSSIPVFVNQQTQTNERVVKIKLKLNNLSAYVQNRDGNSIIMAKLDRITLQNNKTNDDCEVLIRIRNVPKDPECANGLVEVMVENLKLDAYMFTVVGLAELVDDNDDEDVSLFKKKDTIPLNIVVKNCRFNLSDNYEYTLLEQDPKLLRISIEKLELKKLPNSQLVIKEMRLEENDWTKSKNGLLLSPVGLKKEIDCLNQFKYDLTFLEFNSKFKFNSSKFASLVHLLRKSKEENSKLDEEKMTYKNKLHVCEKEVMKFKNENERLKTELEHLKSTVTSTNIIDDSAQKNQSNDEVLRVQFETLLKVMQDENDALKAKLLKSEDNLNILKIERERYLELLKEK